jgi:hypothetical protein
MGGHLAEQTAIVVEPIGIRGGRRGSWLRRNGHGIAVPVRRRDHLQRIGRKQQQQPQRDGKNPSLTQPLSKGKAHVDEYTQSARNKRPGTNISLRIE